MIKKILTFVPYEKDDSVTKTFRFHLTEDDATRLFLKYGDLSEYARKLQEDDARDKVYELLRVLILMSYGELDDGLFRKVKNEQPLYENFAASKAFQVLINELFTADAEGNIPAFFEFIDGIMPEEAKAKANDKVVRIDAHSGAQA